MQWESPNDYLNQFDKNYRGTIGDRFCRAVRNGCEDVRTVLKVVQRDVEQREGDVWREVQRSLSTTEAWDFAQHILDRESLPWDEKQKLKESRDKNPTWIDDPPTEKQIACLKRMGYLAEVKTKGEASSLISSFKTSAEQPKFEVDLDSLPF